MHAMRPNRLLFTLLLLAAWAKALKSSDVTEEMMARMVSLVEEVQQQLEQLEQKNTDLSIDMKRREKEMGEQVKRLEKENAEQSTKLAKLEAKLVKEAGYMMTCAQRSSWPTRRNDTITFDYLTANFNNADSEGGADGQLDIVTGVFTTLTAGVYEVTFSGVSVLGYFCQDARICSTPIEPGGETESSSDQYFYLMHNGESEGDEAEWWSRADPGNVGDTYDMGSRTVILMLQVPHLLSFISLICLRGNKLLTSLYHIIHHHNIT